MKGSLILIASNILAFIDWSHFISRGNEIMTLMNPALDFVSRLLAIATSFYVLYRFRSSKKIVIEHDDIDQQ